MTNLFEMDWDYVEQLIEKELDKRIRAYDDYAYLILDEYHLLVKVYENNQPIFTIKFWFHGGKLEVVEAW